MIPFLHIGPLTLPTFGLMVATAMLCAYFVLRADLARRGIQAEAETLVALPSLAGMAGAKIYHVLETPGDLIADPIGQIFSTTGFAWFGGLIAGIAMFVYLGRKFRIPVLLLFDIASPACALGYGIGRIGCLLSGDGDYGIPTSLPWGMSFPNGIVPTTERVHPTPIYEFIASVVIAWFLWRLGSRMIAGRAADHGARGTGGSETRPYDAARMARGGEGTPGLIFAAFLMATGVERFLVEFIRINPRSFLGMSNAQSVGLISTIVGVWLWWRLSRNSTISTSTAQRT
jgi:phosphatidylglycerol---prolipoprotein diacylglyceryl transferase